MLHLIPHNQIHFSRYNACIAHSLYPVIYAESWYLDIVTKQDWGVLVLGDYDAVMPIPYARMKRLFWKKSIVQPFFCQQLGIFAQQDISHELYDAFYDALKEMQPLVYQFNHENNAFLQQRSKLTERQNYVLDTRKDFVFNSNTKRNISKAKKANLTIETHSITSDFLKFYQQNNPRPFTQKELKIAKDLITKSIEKQAGQIYKVVQGDETVAMLFVLNKFRRMMYSMSATNKKGKKSGAMHYLVANLITNAKDFDLFDFEGSDIAGIAQFFKGFGAERKPYFVWLSMVNIP